MAENGEGLGTVPEHERILQEIESTDTACVGPTLRSVYDDQPNAHKKFMEKLDACIRNHDKEIEKMCNFHHQGFVDAITELLKVRTDAEKLKVQVTDTNRKFQDAGKEVIVQTEDIIRCRIQQRNITTVVEKLQLCLPVLEMYSKLKEQMSAKRERQSMNRGGSERGRQRIRNRLQALSCQHRAQRGAQTHGPRDHDLSRSWPLNRLSHPGAPKREFLIKLTHLTFLLLFFPFCRYRLLTGIIAFSMINFV
uniref:Exocyst complex component EXOC6/Sec15 N-terminal domain-containing protein n=1 Tax=Felis catus TaxID=9685 RepID=A0ABI7XH05_FELCA